MKTNILVLAVATICVVSTAHTAVSERPRYHMETSSVLNTFFEGVKWQDCAYLDSKDRSECQTAQSFLVDHAKWLIHGWYGDAPALKGKIYGEGYASFNLPQAVSRDIAPDYDASNAIAKRCAQLKCSVAYDPEGIILRDIILTVAEAFRCTLAQSGERMPLVRGIWMDQSAYLIKKECFETVQNERNIRLGQSIVWNFLRMRDSF